MLIKHSPQRLRTFTFPMCAHRWACSPLYTIYLGCTCGGARTHDFLLKRQLLLPLSYASLKLHSSGRSILCCSRSLACAHLYTLSHAEIMFRPQITVYTPSRPQCYANAFDRIWTYKKTGLDRLRLPIAPQKHISGLGSVFFPLSQLLLLEAQPILFNNRWHPEVGLQGIEPRCLGWKPNILNHYMTIPNSTMLV